MKNFKPLPPPADPRYPAVNAVFQRPAAGQAAHTPTPWRTAGDLYLASDGQQRVEAVNRPGPFLFAASPADAAFIVRACNEYAANEARISGLVAALQRLCNCPDLGWDELEAETEQALDQARSALALAKGVQS